MYCSQDLDLCHFSHLSPPKCKFLLLTSNYIYGGGGVIIDLKRNEALVNRVTKGGIFLFATFFIRVKKGKIWGVSSYPPFPPPSCLLPPRWNHAMSLCEESLTLYLVWYLVSSHSWIIITHWGSETFSVISLTSMFIIMIGIPRTSTINKILVRVEKARLSHGRKFSW